MNTINEDIEKARHWATIDDGATWRQPCYRLAVEVERLRAESGQTRSRASSPTTRGSQQRAKPQKGDHTMTPTFEAQGVKLYLADCLEVLPTLEGVDAVVTDPFYGVGFKGSATRHSEPTGKTYSFDDTPEAVARVCVPAIELCRKIAKRVALTPGIKCQRLYPQPDGEGVYWYPSGANCGPWGFVMHQPIYYYGKCPFLALGRGSRPTSMQSTESAEDIDHPCPKPIGQVVWLVNRISFEGETVCDPFMGSGTTGIACIRTGRNFIGIEKDPAHFATAVERIKRELAQGVLPFAPPAKHPTQQQFAIDDAGRMG